MYFKFDSLRRLINWNINFTGLPVKEDEPADPAHPEERRVRIYDDDAVYSDIQIKEHESGWKYTLTHIDGLKSTVTMTFAGDDWILTVDNEVENGDPDSTPYKVSELLDNYVITIEHPGESATTVEVL